MTIHEFGTENEKTIVLIHPSAVMWDYFEYVIPYLEKNYHLVIPALPGYDDDEPGDFTSVEEIASTLEDWLLEHRIREVAGIYGCSMGGGIVLRFLADDRVKAHSAVADGGITPYQLPRLVTRLIAVRDFLMIYMGKLGGLKLLEKAFATDDYSDEDLQYVATVLKKMSVRTIWRTFDSCNNYSMPKKIPVNCENLEYWYMEAEEKDRRWDIKYVKKNFPQAVFRQFENLGHGGLAALQPERLADELSQLCER